MLEAQLSLEDDGRPSFALLGLAGPPCMVLVQLSFAAPT